MVYEKFYRILVALYHSLPYQILILREQSSELTSVSALSTSLWSLSENLPRMYSVSLTSWRHMTNRFNSHWLELQLTPFSYSESYLVCKFFFMVLPQWVFVAELIVPVHTSSSRVHTWVRGSSKWTRSMSYMSKAKYVIVSKDSDSDVCLLHYRLTNLNFSISSIIIRHAFNRCFVLAWILLLVPSTQH